MTAPTQNIRFDPHPLLPGGHLQTLAAFFVSNNLPAYRATAIPIDLPDGDCICLHDDCPEDWSPDDGVVLLLHGLAGCHGSPYMVRIAHRLNAKRVRTFRMDMRGTGGAIGSRLPGHAGRTEDAAAALAEIARRCPESSVTLVGFSMGANIVLGTLANASQTSGGNVRRGIAIEPPVDLSLCCRNLRMGTARFYDKYLLRFLLQRWQATGGGLSGRSPKTIYEFDELITAPLSGYRDAEDYYAQCSSGPRLKDITIPTRILAARNDPMVAIEAVESAERSRHVELFVTNSGGHLGFLSRRTSAAPDGRWMDAFVVQHCTSTW